MKIASVITMILLSLGIMILSFQKPAKSAPPIAPGVHAVVNNKPWVAQLYNTRVGIDSPYIHDISLPDDYKIDTIPKRMLQIVGVDTISVSETEIILQIPYFRNTGVYKIDYSSDSSAEASYVCHVWGFNASSGTITIYQVSDSNVQGAFNFVTDSGVTIKNGTFNVRFNCVH